MSAQPSIVDRLRGEHAASGLDDAGAPDQQSVADPVVDPVGQPADATVIETASQRIRRFTTEHVNAIIVVFVVVVVFAGSRMMMARGHEVPATDEPTQLVSVETPPPAMIIIHVTGAVATPGVVELPEGARVIDAIDAAGGLTDDADIADLNLAAKVPDGAQIIVGTVGEPAGVLNAGSQSAGEPASSLVNLNTASPAELETLPGVGPVTAAAIISWRDSNGSFESVEQLQEVDGIGPRTYETLEPLVTV